MKRRSSTVLLAVCLSTPLFAATAAEPRSGEVIVVNGYRAEASQKASPAPSIMRMAVTQLAGSSTVMPVDESHDLLFVAQTDEYGNIVIICTDDRKAAEVTSSESILRVRPRANQQRMAAERE